MSDSAWPHRRKPTRLPCPWASPDKNTGVGCHFLLQCMKVKSESEIVQSCPTLSDPMDCSLPGSAVHGIFQARVLECYYRCVNMEKIKFSKCYLIVLITPLIILLVQVSILCRYTQKWEKKIILSPSFFFKQLSPLGS